MALRRHILASWKPHKSTRAAMHEGYTDVITCDFSSCFSPKFKKLTKRGFFTRNDLFFWFLRPQNRGGGVLLPEFCPKISKTLKFGLFWGIFACSGLVLQNSAAHQCTCL